MTGDPQGEWAEAVRACQQPGESFRDAEARLSRYASSVREARGAQEASLDAQESEPSVSDATTSTEDATPPTSGAQEDRETPRPDRQSRSGSAGGGGQEDRGVVTPVDAAIDGLPAAEIGRARARSTMERMRDEGRWAEFTETRDEMMKLARSKGLDKPAAQLWTYSELDRLYPPLTTTTPVKSGKLPDLPNVDKQAAETRKDADSLKGLSELPKSWPSLADNASLSVELAWVQAQRLRVVEERSSGAARVHLERASTPAPSWAALSWLETSIRSYAKFVDVCAKALSTQQDEQAVMRAERKSLAEVRALLEEMVDAKGEGADRKSDQTPRGGAGPRI